jgi:hypothetical protein
MRATCKLGKSRVDWKGQSMNRFLALPSLIFALAFSDACSSSDDSDDDPMGGSKPRDAATDAGGESSDAGGEASDAGAGASLTALDLNDVAMNPDDYEWFDFRPNLLKLILAGAAETEHVAILWYTVTDGAVGLHYHSKTESVYVIEGTQTDAKGEYSTGTVYFNPPGSGHAITDSSGFFLLAYASPPDFASTDLIEEYSPIRIDTGASDLTSEYPFEETAKDVRTYAVPLDAEGGMSAELIETRSSQEYPYEGNYLLVVEGSCEIGGETYGENMLVYADTITPEPFEIAAAESGSCLAMGLSF